MADIPRYGRRQSESSAVGTPGLDLSGAKIAETVGGVADAAIKARAQKRKIVDTADANRRLVDFDLEASQISQRVQEELSEKNPDEQMAEVKNRLSKRMEEVGRDLKDPDAKRDFNTSAYKVVGTHSQKAFELATKRQTARASENVVTSFNTLSNSVAGIFSDPNRTIEDKMTELTGKIELANKVLDASGAIYSPKEYKKLRDNVPKMLSKGAILGAMQADPQLAIDLLNSGEFDDHIDAEEKEKFYSKAQTIKDRLTKQQIQAQKEAYQENLIKVGNDFLSGNLTLDRLEEDVTGGVITPEVSAAFELALFNPKEWEVFKKDRRNGPTDRGRILMQIVDSIDQDDKQLGDVMMRAVGEYNDERLNYKDLAWIIKTVQEKKNGPDDSYWDYLKEAFRMTDALVGPAGVSLLINRLVEGEDPREAAKDLVQSNAKVRNPKLSVMDEVPNSMMDAFGLVKRLWLGQEKEPGEEAPVRGESYGTDKK